MDVTQLRANLRRAIQAMSDDIPKKIGESMLAETRENFQKQAYTNEGYAVKWADRMGYVRGRGLVNAENLLNYKKLQETGALKNSISISVIGSFTGTAIDLTSSEPYAEAHNTGQGGLLGGNSFKAPPKSKRPVTLGHNPQKRQFMGVGQRTMYNAQKIAFNTIKRIL